MSKVFTMGSLFDGSAGFPFASALCGIKPVWASEIEEFPIKVSSKHFPMMKHLGSVTDINGYEIDPVDVITFGSPCFTGDTEIVTADGNKAIKDIRTSDKIVFGVDGCKKEYQVLNTWDNGIQDIFELTFSDGYACKCTKNHKFLVKVLDSYKWKTIEEIMDNPQGEAMAYLKTDGFTYSDDLALISVNYVGKDRVYDIEVDEVHAFLLKNGIVAHNCQDLSVAGKRKSFFDENGEMTRSGLFYEAIRIIKEMRSNGRTDDDIRVQRVSPRFAVWENVPGAFSSNKGEDFRCVLEELAKVKDECAYIPMPEGGKWHYAGCILGDTWSIAYRTFDAQFWGVPQRRRRIYLVADFDGHCAGEILFERESLHRHFAESREERERIARNLEKGIGAWSED